MKRYLFEDVDSRLGDLALKFEERCIVASGGWGGGSLRDLPADIFAKAEGVVKGLELKSVKRSKVDGVSCHVFLGVTDEMMYEIWITDDGVLYMVSGTPLAPKMEFLSEEMDAEARFLGTDRFYFALFSTSGEQLSSSSLDSWGALAKTPFIPSAMDSPETRVVQLPFGGFDVRVLNHRLPGGVVLQIGANVSKEEDLLSSLAFKLLWLSLPIAALSAVCGWFVAGKAMAGVERVATMADAINVGGDLSRRLPSGREFSEIEDLISSFNAMLARLEKLLREIEEVSDNIAHDLKTPLTRIRGIVETTVASKPETRDYREMAGEVLEECERLVGIVDTMLEITRADSGVVEMDFERLSVRNLLEGAYELFLPLAENKSLEFKLDAPPNGVEVKGDKTRLQRAISNLLDNAVKYTPEGGRVELSARSRVGMVEIIVSDNGQGIPIEERGKVFKRFYRCDSSRSMPGNGLGLSLALAIVKAHGGNVRMECGADGGSVFAMELPVE
jgi:heavy metal sensor kinase